MTTENKKMNDYQTRIRDIAAKQGFVGVSIRGIEAHLRDTFGTLDNITSARGFVSAVRDAADCVIADPGLAEKLADAIGLAK